MSSASMQLETGGFSIWRSLCVVAAGPAHIAALIANSSHFHRLHVGTKTESQRRMSSRAYHIVCGLDLGEFSPVIIEQALDEAHRHLHVMLHFITVLEEGKGVFTNKQPTDAELEEADTRLRFLVAETLPAFADGDADKERLLRFHTRVGKPDEEIVELAYESRAECIIIGRHGAKLHKGKMGSIATRIVEAAPCTVHVIQLSDYEGVDDDFNRCPDCARIREEGTGAWFCKAHQDGRSKRLARSRVGVVNPIPGWGVF